MSLCSVMVVTSLSGLCTVLGCLLCLQWWTVSTENAFWKFPWAHPLMSTRESCLLLMQCRQPIYDPIFHGYITNLLSVSLINFEMIHQVFFFEHIMTMLLILQLGIFFYKTITIHLQHWIVVLLFSITYGVWIFYRWSRSIYIFIMFQVLWMFQGFTSV